DEVDARVRDAAPQGVVQVGQSVTWLASPQPRQGPVDAGLQQLRGQPDGLVEVRRRLAVPAQAQVGQPALEVEAGGARRARGRGGGGGGGGPRPGGGGGGAGGRGRGPAGPRGGGVPGGPPPPGGRGRGGGGRGRPFPGHPGRGGGGPRGGPRRPAPPPRAP